MSFHNFTHPEKEKNWLQLNNNLYLEQPFSDFVVVQWLKPIQNIMIMLLNYWKSWLPAC